MGKQGPGVPAGHSVGFRGQRNWTKGLEFPMSLKQGRDTNLMHFYQVLPRARSQPRTGCCVGYREGATSHAGGGEGVGCGAAVGGKEVDILHGRWCVHGHCLGLARHTAR